MSCEKYWPLLIFQIFPLERSLERKPCILLVLKIDEVNFGRVDVAVEKVQNKTQKIKAGRSCLSLSNMMNEPM